MRRISTIAVLWALAVATMCLVSIRTHMTVVAGQTRIGGMDEATSNLIGQCVLALIGVLTLLLANFARKTAAAVNDAVNHQHADAPKLIDHVLLLSEKIDVIFQWMMSYRGGPLDTGDKVEEFHKFVSEEAKFNRTEMSELRRLIEDCHSRLNQVEDETGNP